MKYLVVRVKPKSFFHLGEREKWAEGSKSYWPADTVFSALCHVHHLLYGEVDSFILEFKKSEPPFLLSSAFPQWKAESFFPFPKNKFLAPEELDELEKSAKVDPKKAKKIQYVNFKALDFLLKGGSLSSLLNKAVEDQEIKIYPSPFINLEKRPDQITEKFWFEENVPRVALSRWTNHPGENFFHFGQVYYQENVALFILVKINRAEWLDKIKSLFFLLSHEGVGGDRTCGKGLFEKPEFDEIDLPLIDGGDGLYCLSPYFPGDDERQGLDRGYYELEERKGYVFSPFGRSLRRRSVRMFTEGSIFPRNIDRRGKLVDVRPEAFKPHGVYRYGLLFSLACFLEAKSNENQS